MSDWKAFIHSRLHSRLIYRQFTSLTIFRSVFQYCLRSTLFLFHCLYIQMLYITSNSPLTNYDIFRQTRSIIDLFFIKQLHFQILLLPVLFLISLYTKAYCRFGYFCRLLVLACFQIVQILSISQSSDSLANSGNTPTYSYRY